MRAPSCLPFHHALWAAAWLSLVPSAHAEVEDGAASGATCARDVDDRSRLACYDKLFKAPPAAEPAAPPVPSSEAPDAPATARSVISTFWELGEADKRKAFVVRTYLPNYLLPAHVTSGINRAPSSPTRGVAPNQPHYRQTEAKLQVSLRAKVIDHLLLPGANLWVAYTQRSMWQVWNQKDSAPFRSTDYQPEVMYVVPVPDPLATLPWGWSWRMLDLGFAHQSNGQSEPLSRSWNRLYAGTALERGDLSLQFRFNRRPREGSQDDNPDLTRYIGNTDVTATWLPGLATASLTWRLHPRELKNGSLQFDWTYPVDRTQAQGLRWYVQLFSGYGETLLDYNHRQTSVGLGLSLFQF